MTCSQPANSRAQTDRQPRSVRARVARALLLALLICISWSAAQAETAKLRVATRIVPPMVVEKNGTLSGFSIELWNSIGKRLNRETEYLVLPDVSELLDAVGSGRADLAIAAIEHAGKEVVANQSVGSIRYLLTSGRRSSAPSVHRGQ